MQKIVILLGILTLFLGGCGNRQAKTTNNELVGEEVISAQNDVMYRILSQNEVEQLFTDGIKKTFGIQYPIWRVFAYNDNLGEHRIVLTENVSVQPNNNAYANNDTVRLNIKAFFFRLENNTLTKEREMYDFAKDGEASIWFWTKYCDFSDIDGDGLVDPIIVYGTKSPDDSSPYRVNILVYYKGEKYAQRHTDGDLDFFRSTQIDETFHTLPKVIQERVKNITEEMIKNRHVLEW